MSSRSRTFAASGVLARTSSRDEAAKILDPEAMVTVGYDGTGEVVGITVAVREMRSSSSFGMRFTSTKVMPSKPEFYVDKIVATVVKQLDALLLDAPRLVLVLFAVVLWYFAALSLISTENCS